MRRVSRAGDEGYGFIGLAGGREAKLGALREGNCARRALSSMHTAVLQGLKDTRVNGDYSIPGSRLYLFNGRIKGHYVLASSQASPLLPSINSDYQRTWLNCHDVTYGGRTGEEPGTSSRSLLICKISSEWHSPDCDCTRCNVAISASTRTKRGTGRNAPVLTPRVCTHLPRSGSQSPGLERNHSGPHPRFLFAPLSPRPQAPNPRYGKEPVSLIMLVGLSASLVFAECVSL